jgi:hypothetical protein
MEPAPTRDARGRWLTGTSGNPAGRPMHARHRFGEDFIRDAHEAWKKHGKAALEEMRNEDPSGFVKAMVMLVPKELGSPGRARLIACRPRNWPTCWQSSAKCARARSTQRMTYRIFRTNR